MAHRKRRIVRRRVVDHLAHHQEQGVERQAEHQEAGADHDAEGPVDDGHRRDVVARRRTAGFVLRLQSR